MRLPSAVTYLGEHDEMRKVVVILGVKSGCDIRVKSGFDIEVKSGFDVRGSDAHSRAIRSSPDPSAIVN